MITSLSISRFKAIREESLSLKSLNLLAGANGVGKSSCLQPLLLLRQSWIAKTLPDVGLLLRGPLTDLGRGEDVLNQFVDEDSIEFGIEADGISVRWKFNVERDRGLDHEILPLIVNESSAGDYERAPFNRGFRYLSAERVRPEVAYETSFYSVRELDEIGSKGEFAVHYLAEHQNRALGIPKLRHHSLSDRQSDLLSNVRAWMGEISPGMSLATQQFAGINKATIQYDYDVGPIQVFNPIRPTNVGFGITYCFPIIVAVLSSKPGDTIVIENPESHLHPSGQSQVGRLLALASAEGVQVFLETHSDHVLNGIRLAVKRGEIPFSDVAIFSFDRPAGDDSHKVTIATPRIDKDGKIDSWPPGFFDEAEKLLFELL